MLVPVVWPTPSPPTRAASVVAEAGRRLDDLGLPFFADAGRTPVTFTLVQSEGIVRLQAAFSVFDRLATVLPWAVILLFGAAVAVAPKRRAVVRAGGGVMAGALVLLLGLAAARSLYLGALPVGASVPANEMVFDTLTRFLRGGGRTVLAIGVVMATAAALTGPVGAFSAQHLTGLRVGVGLLAVLVLLGVDRPSGGTILWLGIGTAVVLAVVELLARTGATVPSADSPGARVGTVPRWPGATPGPGAAG